MRVSKESKQLGRLLEFLCTFVFSQSEYFDARGRPKRNQLHLVLLVLFLLAKEGSQRVWREHLARLMKKSFFRKIGVAGNTFGNASNPAGACSGPTNLAEKIVDFSDQRLDILEMRSDIRRWNRSFVGVDVLQVADLESQLESQFLSTSHPKPSASLGLTGGSSFLEEDRDLDLGFLGGLSSRSFLSGKPPTVGPEASWESRLGKKRFQAQFGKTVHLNRNVVVQESTLLVQTAKFDLLVLNHLNTLFPVVDEGAHEKAEAIQRFQFWSNRDGSRANAGLLLHADKANLITRPYSDWLVNRFDETDLGFFNQEIRLVSHKQFIKHFTWALQGLPNCLFDIVWAATPAPPATAPRSHALEVNLDVSALSQWTRDYLADPNVKPVCTPKPVKIEGYTRRFSSEILESLKSKVEAMLAVFQIHSSDGPLGQSRDYFETSLLQKIKELIISYYSYRMLSFEGEAVSVFLPQLDQFHLEMAEVLRFLHFAKSTPLGLLDLCHAFKSSITQESPLFRWIQR